MKKINKIANISLVTSLLFIVVVYLIPFSWKVENWLGYYLDWFSVLLFLPILIVTVIWLLIKLNKVYSTYKKENILFYVFLLINNILLLIPNKHKVAVYSISFLGFLYLVTFFLAFLLFIRLFYLDYKRGGAKKNLIARNIVFIVAIILYITVYHYK